MIRTLFAPVLRVWRAIVAVACLTAAGCVTPESSSYVDPEFCRQVSPESQPYAAGCPELNGYWLMYNQGVSGELPIQGYGGDANALLYWPIPGMMRLPVELPRPSTQIPLDRNLVVAAGKTVSLKDVALRLERALRQAGYSDFSYFQTRSTAPGFALVTRMERVEEDGSARARVERFLPPGAEGPFDLGAYFQSLFVEPKGYYRIVFFLVSAADPEFSGGGMTGSLAAAYATTGETRLPPQFNVFRFTDQHTVDVLVYEFMQKGDKAVSVVPPVRLPAQTHLSRSGIEGALASTPKAGQ